MTADALNLYIKFQHTAARRRLGFKLLAVGRGCFVSTHSRPKAAGSLQCSVGADDCCFNTQPPEGGWIRKLSFLKGRFLFQHTAARRRLVKP